MANISISTFPTYYSNHVHVQVYIYVQYVYAHLYLIRMRYDQDTLALRQIPNCYSTISTTTSQDTPGISYSYMYSHLHRAYISTYLTSLFHDKHITASVWESALSEAYTVNNMN